ncbi:MAG: HAMP domain-containing protein [Clostridia bacterium]|nr:HAMP domain-containing protein [Clostridia bacterium]
MKHSRDSRETRGPGRRSIYARILTGYFALSLLLTGLTGALSYLLLRHFTTAQYIGSIGRKAHEVAEALARDKDGITYEDIRTVERLTGAYIGWIDTEYTVRFIQHRSSGPEGGESAFEVRTLDGDEEALVRRIIDEGERPADVRYMDFLNSRVLYAGAPIHDEEGRVTGGVIIYQAVQELRAVTHSTVLVILVSLVTAGFVSVLLALFMTRQITRPIRALTRSACHIGKGHYGELVEVNRRDEIGELGQTLNDMSLRLKETVFDLQNEKAKLDEILSGIGEGIVAVNQEGEIIHRNAAAMALLEMNRYELPNVPHRQHLLDMLSAAVATRERAETQWVNESGRVIHALVWPLLNGAQEIIGAVGLLRDVTESERMEQMRRDYVANVSHELRTPLTGIRGMVEPLMDGYIETEEEKMDCYRVIYQETLRLEKLIGEMLDMSRLQSGRQTVELEPMDVMGILHGAARRMKDRAAEGKIDLRVDEAAQPLPLVMGNEDRIMQVLIILLDNAMSFTPPGGRVTVYARRDGDRVWIGVRDTGSGIDPADMPYIWERFYKADKSRMRTTGTGLGLSIAKLLCELMNGRITATSAPGCGATFEFSLAVCGDCPPA